MSSTTSTWMDSIDDEIKKELPPIYLPKGVSQEYLAKVVFNVLYRKALDVTDEWSKWLILATLHILETNDAPYLDITALYKLQGLSEMDATCMRDMELEGNEDQSLVNVKQEDLESCVPEEVSKHDMELGAATTSRSPSRKRSHSGGNSCHKILKKSEDDDHVTYKDAPGLEDDSQPEIAEKSHDVPKEVIKLETVEEIQETCFTSETTQVNPWMLCVNHNKWTQMWKKKLVSRDSQTEFEMVNNAHSSVYCQTDDLLDVSTSDNKTLIHQDVQTIICNYRDFSCQYPDKPKIARRSQNTWKLVPVPGLKADKVQKSKSTDGQRQDESEIKSSKDVEGIGSTSLPESNVVKDKKSENGAGTLINKKLRKNLFHGRPMITSKSQIAPPNIPMSPVDSFLLNDPRSVENY